MHKVLEGGERQILNSLKLIMTSTFSAIIMQLDITQQKEHTKS